MGKTTIYNKLCDTYHATKYSNESLTREIRKSFVAYGNNSFSILDTPGNNSKTYTIQHALLLKEALTVEPLNAIFVIINYDARVEDKMLDDYDDTMKCLTSLDNKNMIILIVSKFDQCDVNDQKRAKQDII